VLLERIARDELGMGRPGEIVYEIIDRKQERDEPAAREAEPRTDAGAPAAEE